MNRETQLHHHVAVHSLARAGEVCRACRVRTTDGKQDKNVTISCVEPDGIVIIVSTGIIKLPDLPEQVRQNYSYDPAAAKAFTEKIKAANTLLLLGERGL